MTTGHAPTAHRCPICEQPVARELESGDYCERCEDDMIKSEMRWFKNMLRKDKEFRRMFKSPCHPVSRNPATL